MSKVPGSEQVLGKAKWIQLMSCDYEVKHPETGESKVCKGWEYIQRTTYASNGISAAQMIPILKHADGRKQLLMIANYRPPVDKFVWEFPAGLIDEGEIIEVAGGRELKEETGYKMTKILDEFPQPATFDDAPTSTCKTKNYVVEVDMEHPDNKNVKPELEVGEMIQVYLFDIEKNKSLLSQVIELSEKKGIELTTIVYSLLIGLELGQKLLS